MTTVLARVPIDRISAEARAVRAGRLLLSLVGALFFVVGWLAAKVFLAFVWCAVAVKIGWLDARKAVQHGSAG